MPKSPDFSHIQHWIFDLDGTLYDPAHDYARHIAHVYRSFVQGYFGLSEAELDAHSEILSGRKKGTIAELPITPASVAAMEQHIEANLDTHILTKCLESVALMQQLRGQKVVFTNSDHVLAMRTLRQLGLEAHFDVVNDHTTRGHLAKHNIGAFHHMLNHAEIGDPTFSVLVEDSVHNLEHAKSLGMTTVLVYSWTDAPHVDYCYPDGLRTFLQDAVQYQAK